MTSEKEVEALLKAGESATLEFKESFGSEALEVLASFASTHGGALLVGVRDDSTVKGLSVGRESLRDWSNQIAQATGLNAEIESVSYEGKNVVVIKVSESPLKMVPCRGRFFKRVGKSTRQMTEDDITRAVLDKVGMTWDEVVESRATMADIDPEQMRRFRSLCNFKGRRLIPEGEDDATVLEKLELLKDGRPIRAAALLFGKNPQRFYGSALVKIGRFRSPTHIVDDREVRGTLFDQVEGTELYFREHLQTEFVMTGRPARDVIWEYPLAALREAITNAVCHRDYLDTGHTQVRWYDERLTILNPGELLPPLTLELLKREHRSVIRNRKLAEMFYYAGWIEQWGSGVGKIIGECLQAGLPEPEFEEKQAALWLTFRKDVLTDEYLRSLGLNERQVLAVQTVRKKGEITNREYQQLTQVSRITATRDLTSLAEKGVLKLAGSGKRDAHYVLNDAKMMQK